MRWFSFQTLGAISATLGGPEQKQKVNEKVRISGFDKSEGEAQKSWIPSQTSTKPIPKAGGGGRRLLSTFGVDSLAFGILPPIFQNPNFDLFRCLFAFVLDPKGSSLVKVPTSHLPSLALFMSPNFHNAFLNLLPNISRSYIPPLTTPAPECFSCN